ncbi:MAG: DUF4185 domain-containing protein [Polyangiaceae bacterium]
MRAASIPRLSLLVASVAVSACGRADLHATVEDLGVVPQSSAIQGRDGGCSGLAFGHSVWTFGDTVLNMQDAEGTNWHHNSFSITDDLDGRDGVGGFTEPTDAKGAPLYFISPTVDEAKFNADHRGEECAVAPCGARFAVWPGPPIWDEARNRALVFYGLIYAEPGDFNFRGVGQSVAVWDDFAAGPQRPEVASGAAHPTMLFAEGEPGWGAGAAIDGDDVYAFECGARGGSACSLAKVPADSVLDRAAWRYFDGDAWISDMDERATLFDGAPSMGVAFNKHLGAWTVIYAEPLSNDVVLRTAPELSGPWSDAALLFVANKPDGSAYDANVHRELEEDGGRVMYVTFSRSNGQGWFGSEFDLVRVTLP